MSLLNASSLPVFIEWRCSFLFRLREYFLHYKKICQFNFLSQPPVTTAFHFGQYSKLIIDTLRYSTWFSWSVSIQMRHLRLITELLLLDIFGSLEKQSCQGPRVSCGDPQGLVHSGSNVTPRQSPGGQIWLESMAVATWALCLKLSLTLRAPRRVRRSAGQ